MTIQPYKEAHLTLQGNPPPLQVNSPNLTRKLSQPYKEALSTLKGSSPNQPIRKLKHPYKKLHCPYKEAHPTLKGSSPNQPIRKLTHPYKKVHCPCKGAHPSLQMNELNLKSPDSPVRVDMGLFSMPSCDWSCECSCVSLLREETLVKVSSVWFPLGVTTRLELELGGVFGILSPETNNKHNCYRDNATTCASFLSLKFRKISFTGIFIQLLQFLYFYAH